MIAAWSKFQLIVVAPNAISLGGSNLNIQIQGHFKKMDSEFSAVDSFVKTKYTFLDHNKRFLVICLSPTLSTFKNVKMPERNIHGFEKINMREK